jgi:hypothetical protein
MIMARAMPSAVAADQAHEKEMAKREEAKKLSAAVIVVILVRPTHACAT